MTERFRRHGKAGASFGENGLPLVATARRICLQDALGLGAEVLACASRFTKAQDMGAAPIPFHKGKVRLEYMLSQQIIRCRRCDTDGDWRQDRTAALPETGRIIRRR